MGSLRSLMDMSQQALMANQNALSVTANNVANQNTAGYTRQVVTWQATDAVTLSGRTYNAGISATAVSQRDRILEQRLQQQTQAQAQSGALESALQQVQNIFGLSSTATSASSTALGTAINSFFSALSALTGNPSDTATRQGVLTAANTLASAFNSASSQLKQVASGLNQQFSDVVGQINSLTTTIASLNHEIGSSSPGKDAGVLEDKRQLAITQLSQLIGLDQISTENNGLTLTTTNGVVLVSGSQAVALQATPVAGSIHVFVEGQDIGLEFRGGQVGGIILARDHELSSYIPALDNLAYAIGMQVNIQNAAGLDGNGNPGQWLFGFSGNAAGAATTMYAGRDPAAIAAASVGEGSAGNGNALALADLWSAGIVGGQTASGFYSALLGLIGSATAGASTDNAAQQAVLTQLTTQRSSLSGVSLDEEAANLTQYQRSYQAAAKVFSIVDTLMASAINLGERTTVS